MSSVAWGTWRNRWKHYDRDFGILLKILKDKEKKSIFDTCGYDILPICQAQLEGRSDSWALFWTLLQIDKKAVCVIPVKYLAKDIGHSGVGGTNSTAKTTRYDTDLYDMTNGFCYPPDIAVDERIMSSLNVIINSNRDRETAYIKLLSDWIRSYQRKLSISACFESKGINEVVIYGSGTISELLIEELKGKIKIKSIIVLDKEHDSFCGYPLYDFRDDLDISDSTIIVTPVFDMDYITYSLKKRFGTDKVIGLNEIFN